VRTVNEAYGKSILVGGKRGTGVRISWKQARYGSLTIMIEKPISRWNRV